MTVEELLALAREFVDDPTRTLSARALARGVLEVLSEEANPCGFEEPTARGQWVDLPDQLGGAVLEIDWEARRAALLAEVGSLRAAVEERDRELDRCRDVRGWELEYQARIAELERERGPLLSEIGTLRQVAQVQSDRLTDASARAVNLAIAAREVLEWFSPSCDGAVAAKERLEELLEAAK